MLDVEYVSINNLATSDYYYSQDSDFFNFANDIANRTDAPLVLSVSYGEDENAIDNGTLQTTNIEFLKLGLQGFTVFIASGDSGIYAREECTVTVGFPASSPYVTAVGSTYYNPRSKEEIVVDFSGGGFS